MLPFSVPPGRNCQGPLKNIRHSQGRRCPRNQPTALWELLQQSLARKQKVSPWTKPHLLSWSPTHTGNAYWPRYVRPALHSPLRPLPTGSTANTAPVVSHGSRSTSPTASVLPQYPSSVGLYPPYRTTENPLLMDSLLPDLDLSQISRRRGSLGHQVSNVSPPAITEPMIQSPVSPYHVTTPTSPTVQRRVRPDTVESPPLEVPLGSSPSLSHGQGEGEQHVQPVHHHHHPQRHRPDHYRHHHKQLSTNLKDQRPRSHSSNVEDDTLTQPARLARDQRVTKAQLDWSTEVTSNAPISPFYLTTPHHDTKHQ